MPDYIGTVNADSNGDATFTLPAVASGLEWILQQIGVATNPRGSNVIANISRNGQLIASTNQGSQGSAGGQPYYKIGSGDAFTIVWSGAPTKCQCVVTISYSEHNAGDANAFNTGIV
jgi:hypothetical protein